MAIKNYFDLSGDTVVITGGGTGLAKQFATVLGQAGAAIALCARRVETLEETADIVRRHRGTAHGIPMDVANKAVLASA
ncbi:MAG: gluconate 5-dehydrogenase [Alcanivorax sp.]|jgi:gluconate 5-dehydrogenase